MKTRLIAKICCFLQLHRLAYFLNRNRKRIITFHNVLDDDVFVDDVANGVSTSLSDFKIIIDEIGNRFAFSLDLDDASTVTVTFDDGYNNQAEIAASYLIAKNIPAYLFISGQLIVDNDKVETEPLTIDKLLHWVSHVPPGMYDLRFDDKIIPVAINDDNRNIVWGNIIWPLFTKDTAAKGENVFNALNEAYSYTDILKCLSPKYVKQRLTGVTPRQIKRLKDAGWQIGWHTYSHYPVALLAQNERHFELTPDPMCDSTVFSYPYGGVKDADAASVEILKSKGLRTAVSNISSGNGHLGNWYRSRMSLSPDSVLLHFELSGLKYMLKYRKLLPKI